MGTSDSNNPAGNEPDPSGDGGEGNEPEGKEEGKTKEERLFTKADVEREIANRLKREKAANKELADKAKKFDEMQEAQKTEAEKQATAQAEAQAKAEAAESRAKSLALKSAVAMACLKNDVAEVEIVQSLIGDASKWDFDPDDGEPIGIDERVAEIVKAKPFLKGTKFAGSADGGKSPDKVDPKDPDALGKLSMEDYMAARDKWSSKT